MPNGTPDVDPLAENRALAQETFRLPAQNVFMYCGQLNWKKNILRILESAAVVAREGWPFTLVLTGQGPDAAAIRSKAAELGLADRTVFTGHITEERLLYGLYEAATLFVFPSLYDTSGMVVREAAAMETPSVVVRGTGAAEAVTDGQNGFLCDDATESLAAVLRRALGSPEKAKALGKDARKTIYTPWSSIIDDACERYEALIASYRRAHPNKGEFDS